MIVSVKSIITMQASSSDVTQHLKRNKNIPNTYILLISSYMIETMVVGTVRLRCRSAVDSGKDHRYRFQSIVEFMIRRSTVVDVVGVRVWKENK